MKPEEEPEEVAKVNPQRIGSFNEGKYLVTDDEINWIAKHYVLMHAAR